MFQFSGEPDVYFRRPRTGLCRSLPLPLGFRGSGLLVFLAAATAYAYRLGWHRLLWRNRVRASIIAVPPLVVMLWLGWPLGSPLFTNTTVDEEFPFAANATVPEDMDIEAVEAVMSGMAKVESPVSEDMPDMLAKAPKDTPVPQAAPAEQPAEAGPVIPKSGQFQDIDGFHKGTGTATIYEGADGSRLLRFEDFKLPMDPNCTLCSRPTAAHRKLVAG